MPERVSLSDLEERDVDGFEPGLQAIGYHLQPDEMRPSVWTYEAGESNRRHRHEAQEELYTPLSGRVRVEFDDGAEELGTGDFVVAPAEEWRRVTALEDATLLAVGAPNEAHDAMFPEDD